MATSKTKKGPPSVDRGPLQFWIEDGTLQITAAFACEIRHTSLPIAACMPGRSKSGPPPRGGQGPALSCALNTQRSPGAIPTVHPNNRGSRRRNFDTPARMGLPPRKTRPSLVHRQPRRHTKPRPQRIHSTARMPHADHGARIMPLTNQHPRSIQKRLPARLHKNTPLQARHEPPSINLTLPRSPTRRRLQNRRDSDDEHATTIAQKPLRRRHFWIIRKGRNFSDGPKYSPGNKRKRNSTAGFDRHSSPHPAPCGAGPPSAGPCRPARALPRCSTRHPTRGRREQHLSRRNDCGIGTTCITPRSGEAWGNRQASFGGSTRADACMLSLGKCFVGHPQALSHGGISGSVAAGEHTALLMRLTPPLLSHPLKTLAGRMHLARTNPRQQAPPAPVFNVRLARRHDRSACAAAVSCMPP
jgi:hypothetical protein